jgi:FixJ family two-component response regulator
VDTVLVLDDDSANLQGIADVLRSEDYSVMAASTGLQAIEAGRGCRRIALFVSDMDLPNPSGTEIALKLVASYPNLPVLFISGTPIVWWTRRDLGNFSMFPPTNVEFIEKPLSASQLLMRVRTMIGRSTPAQMDKNQAA